jgi:tripartite-type tricarboxylate transporter receptor subunit TctC
MTRRPADPRPGDATPGVDRDPVAGAAGRRSFHRLLVAAGAGAALGGVGSRATAADEPWPTRPVRLVVAFATGSGNDLIARQLAPRLGETLGQPFVVENRTGAGGMIGTETVARAAPDGHTIGLGTSSQLVMNPALLPKLPFDVDRDLVTVGLVSRTQMVLAGRRDGAPDLRTLVARARAEPGRVSYGSGGNGSISHIVAETFARAAGVQLLHVPYKGNGPAMQDLAGGQIDLVFDGFSTSGPLMKAGQIRVLAVSGERRNALFPEVPTFAEGGVADYEAYTWNCLFAPRATPRPVVERLNRALNRALAEPELRGRLESYGAENLGGSTPESADAFAAAQRARWIPAVRAMGIRLE